MCSWCVYHQPCESQMAECMDPKQLLYIIFRVKCKSWKIFLYGAPGVRVYMHVSIYIYILYMNRYFIYQKGILIHQTHFILAMFGNVWEHVQPQCWFLQTNTTQSLETNMQNSKHMPIPCLAHDHDYDYDHVLHALHHVHGLVLAHRRSHRWSFKTLSKRDKSTFAGMRAMF